MGFVICELFAILRSKTCEDMDKTEKEALEKEIRSRYPGIAEKEITLMLSFFDMMQAKAEGYSMATGAKKGNARKTASGEKKKEDRLVDSTRPGQTYIIYVSIEDCPVKVFRRIRVPSNLWLGNLSRFIIEAIGWDGYHLWQFTKNDVNYTTKSNIEVSMEDGFAIEAVDDMTVTVADILPQKGSTATFEYDFGDSWIHKVRVSSVIDDPCPAESIKVISGKGACPPEDVGGVGGYSWMLDILSGKVDEPEEKSNYEEWLGLEEGETFDTEDFDIDDANDCVDAMVDSILKGMI